LQLVVIYRPPPSKQNGLKTATFLEDEWPLFLSNFSTNDRKLILVGDLNFHLDNVANHDTIKFNSTLQSCGMRQHVNEPTHVAGHTLDVLITRDTDSIVSNISVSDPGISDGSGKTSRDHYAVTFLAAAAKPAPIRKTLTYRKTKSIDVGDFRRDRLYNHQNHCKKH